MDLKLDHFKKWGIIDGLLSFCFLVMNKTLTISGWEPGLVVMGGGSCFKGRGFKSHTALPILDDHFSHLFVVKIVLFV